MIKHVLRLVVSSSVGKPAKSAFLEIKRGTCLMSNEIDLKGSTERNGVDQEGG